MSRGDWAPPGLNSVAEYQASGTPFVTASNGTEITSTATTKISFPRVTRWVDITSYVNAGASYLKVAFTENGMLERGKVEPSVPIGDPDPVTGDVPTRRTIPAPSTYEQSAKAKNWFAIPVNNNGSVRLELTCKEIFLRTDAGTAGVTVCAGLTGVPASDLNLTGSNGTYGVG